MRRNEERFSDNLLIILISDKLKQSFAYNHIIMFRLKVSTKK